LWSSLGGGSKQTFQKKDCHYQRLVALLHVRANDLKYEPAFVSAERHEHIESREA
jgi:hypothetical protein